MSEVILATETGRTHGSPSSRRLRAEDRIPGVVYGNGVGPVSVSVARRDLRVALTGPAGTNAVLTLTVDGNKHAAVIKELQRDKVKRNVSHVDFLVVNLNVVIDVEVPIVLHGESKAVNAGNGLVDLQHNTMTVSTKPADIPNEISIDVTDMEMDTVIKVSDIVLPANVTTPMDPDTVLVTVLVTRAAVEEEEVAAEGEEAAEGDAPAAEGEEK
jgi:large subunit ribosomal protein L25